MIRFNLYDNQQTGKLTTIIVAAAVVICFLIVSNNLVRQLARQERGRMDIWAAATERLAKTGVDSDYEFLLSIISQNNSIPVMIADENFNISEFRNFNLPDKEDSDKSLYGELTDKNKAYLNKRLHSVGGDTPLAEMAAKSDHFIKVELAPGINQYIYYEDSRLLRWLKLYPYVLMCVMMVLVIILYIAVVNAKRAEQNRVWVGLSKETAHQLGTPISSLMAWVEYLQAAEPDGEVAGEINKDVQRLSTIADRFSKIGSMPEMELEYINESVERSLRYMRSRVSGHVDIRLHPSPDEQAVRISPALFEWVMENLTKNAVDAMQGKGNIDITTGSDKNCVWIEVKDTGKGIARKNFKTVFRPGYTTKKRGWGLGLTLVKRIVEEYHGGKIFVKESEPGAGTTFRIEFKALSPENARR
ncbi:MAG: HAMP domain-containing histidine kinase [Candidatus Amulumruptor caecigallinarius]|nr:HAMP domain-containing histidine kinase [Candidatus Amulumruptor caecigallinarius]